MMQIMEPCKKSSTLWHDRQWGAALLAAPVVWMFLYSIDQPDIQPNWPVSRPWLFLMLTAVYPMLEEIVFRGIFQAWLHRKTSGKPLWAGISQANFFTSIVFSLLHLTAHSVLMATLVLIPSLVFGYFRDRYNGWLIPSIALHCFYNAGYFLIFKPIS